MSEPLRLRVATFNASLYDQAPGGLVARLRAGDENARRIAAIVQRVRPDILLLNEFDYDAGGEAADLFRTRYLEVGQHGQQAIHYPWRYLAPVNTGVPSGLDLDGDGQVGGEGRQRGNDAWGYGLHPGQYGMLVLSRHPLDAGAARSFRLLKWSALPRASRPRHPDGRPFHPPEVWQALRLSSKSHWDLPADTPLGRIHLLAAHPTPPVFDGPERRNAHRNHDEIRLWAEYLNPGNGDWLCDDDGRCGGLAEGERFVILGDYNADPADGASLPGAIHQLLEHPRVLRMATPRSEGGPETQAAIATAQAAAGETPPEKRGAPAHATAVFGRAGVFRVDYVLPSVGFRVVDSGVFWPREGEPGAEWLDASDHRLVWVDLEAADAE
ncbi:endonuclease/exonuclease/phosphatase family protein [Arenimonas fontis]|uniref:Endonuclease/exonuclease/phosphatase family protein n=2 Tax=Arenimonas fontis TaxID=2608255 RepID=A0A5B2ZE85_9GAMM|nr:endonuclease/exonuclease/phosphatase family protein [Arenimonas fontis]KAA2286215.1 endonuclease/exonuclease/phosphatase family protein [Arenimonas fontis]